MLKFRKRIEADENNTIALAFRGGSFTAATVTASALRGFYQQKITTIDGKTKPALDKITYVAGVSGGTMPIPMFAYARHTSDELLDADGINDPKEITAEELETIPEKSIFKRLTAHCAPNVLKAVVSAAITEKTFFSEFMYFQCLEPLGIPKDQPLEATPLRDGVNYTPVLTTAMHGPVELDPSWMYEVMNVSYSEKFANAAHSFDIFTLLEGTDDAKTYLKMDSTSTLFKLAEETGFQIPIPGFITPEKFEVGHPPSKMQFDSSVEGVSAEPINFSPFSVNPDALQLESEGAMTIEKFLALATNCVPITISAFSYGGIDLPDKLEAIFMRPLRQKIMSSDGDERIVPFTDGGLADSAGIPALVKLKTRKIIYPLMLSYSKDKVIEKGPVMIAVDCLLPLFGLCHESSKESTVPGKIFIGFFSYFMSAGCEALLDPMSNDENQLDKFYVKAKSLHEAGQPIIVSLENLSVVENRFWGIEGGGLVDLTIIVVLDVPENFSKQIDPSVAPPPEGRSFTENGFFTNEDLQHVPNPISSSENVRIDLELPFLDLSIHQEVPDFDSSVGSKECKMTEVLLTWIIKEAWNGLSDANGEEVFAGFKDIFGDVKEKIADNSPPFQGEGTDEAPLQEGDIGKSPDAVSSIPNTGNDSIVKDAVRKAIADMKPDIMDMMKEVMEENFKSPTIHNHYFYTGSKSNVIYGNADEDINIQRKEE